MNPLCESAPKWKRPRMELPPDVPESSTSLPFVLTHIQRNNAETRPKRRQTLFDILNDAFVDRIRCNDVTTAFEVLKEGREKHAMLPRSSSLAAALYALHKSGDTQHGVSLINFLLTSKDLVPEFFKTSVDEKVVTVALRSVDAINDDAQRRAITRRLMSAVDADSARRRMFAPVFAQCSKHKDSEFMVECLRAGLAAGVEFWDSDYSDMLSSLPEGPIGTQEAGDKLRHVLSAIEAHHPVLGARNAASIAAKLGGVEAAVDASAQCTNCKEVLRCFDFSEAERCSFASDIMEKLIRPRVHCVSHYEPDKAVSDAVRQSREEELSAFLSRITSSDYDAVIDGANIGYYGLSHWYHRAKAEQLTRKGVDVSRVSYGELHTVPFPVDVPPQFDVIDDMVHKAKALGFRPVVVLHNRHTIADRISSKADQTLLSVWRERGELLASPSFLNDDYCWLLAAVTRPRCSVISNDLMRDHHFSMLSQRSFLRWRQRYRVTYRAYVNSVSGVVSLTLRRPAAYSVWVQQSSSGRWHLPFMRQPVLDQATNKIRNDSDAPRDDLDKDGGDHCDAWICTQPFA